MDLPASNSRPRAAWRRLAALAVPVLAAHLVLLQGTPRRVAPLPAPSLQFATRSVGPTLPASRGAAPSPAVPARAAATQPKPARLAPGAPHPAVEGAGHAPRPAAAPAAPAAPPAAAPLAAPPAARNAGPHRTAPPATVPVHTLALPAPARLHYQVILLKGGITLEGRALLEWRHDGREYEVRLEASSLSGPRVQRSTGRITPDGLVPGYFSDKGRGEQATHFDRAHGRLVFSNNRPEAPLADGMQDRLSVLVQLAGLVAGEPGKYPPGTRIAIPTATTREADDWIFLVEAQEDLQLPGGAVRALKLVRVPRHDYDQKVELWLAPGLDYAPVRLRLTNPNGDTADQRWSATDKG